jgi:hypothetical protein
MQENIISEMQNIIKSNSRNTSENGEYKNVLPAISNGNNEEKSEYDDGGGDRYDKNEIQKVIEKSKIRLEKMTEKVLGMFVFIYVYIYMYVCIYVFMYIHLYKYLHI